MGEIMLGLAVATIGIVFALDVGGFTGWHSRVSHDSVSFLRYVPPWRWLVKADRETLIKRQVVQSRITGAIFATIGVWILVSGVLDLMH